MRSKIKIIPISEIKPHPRNPNGHGAEQVGLLAQSAKKYEQVRNIVVWNSLIIAGEGFWRGAKKAGLKEIEVKDVSHWPEAKALAYMYDDNELARKSELNPESVMLLVELSEQDGDSPLCMTDEDRARIARMAERHKRKPFQSMDELTGSEGTGKGNGSGASERVIKGKTQNAANEGKFPLAIILDAPTNRAWQDYKARVGKKQDTAAFLEMFEAVMRTEPGSETKSG